MHGLILASVAANLAGLASLGPITEFFTLSTSIYPFMKLLNFFFFAVSGLIGLKVPLLLLITFVLCLPSFFIQMGGVPRPFIGDPDLPVAFFRAGAWGNAYVVVGGMVVGAAGRLTPSPFLAISDCGLQSRLCHPAQSRP